MNYSMGMEAKHRVDIASRPTLMMWDSTLDSMLSSHGLCRLNAYSHHVKRKNGKFTFGGINVVLSVDGGMGCYSYIAQSVAWGYLR
ncbi:hypothetical protein MTR67_035940 [Solanum verrucosum]|uniref:Uncharacterized protein n=1 Tax=Solanum verrucosum TaxID=315347 RepID=A0AAF0UB37_SOLVR|nr:hypothetical protein MTR67_035940 [Solanum verrucosum]